jgi:hypothetical protein
MAVANNMEMAIDRFTKKMELLLDMERKAELEESELILNKYSVKVSPLNFIYQCVFLGTRKEGSSTVKALYQRNQARVPCGDHGNLRERHEISERDRR